MGTTQYLWSSVTDNIVAEFDDLGATQASNTHLPEEFGELVAQHDTATHFHHYDDRGSTVAITDDAGNVEDEFEYNAFGEEVAHTGASETPYRFQGAYGYYTDTDLGSIYIRRRTYEPETGRWLSEDPIGFVDGTNLYRAFFIPSGIDPSGMLIYLEANAQHQEVCVDLRDANCRRIGKICINFALSGFGIWPMANSDWLGHCVGAFGCGIGTGTVRINPPDTGATLASVKKTNCLQDRAFYERMNRINETKDVYSVATFNCRLFAQLEFSAAPGELVDPGEVVPIRTEDLITPESAPIHLSKKGVNDYERIAEDARVRERERLRKKILEELARSRELEAVGRLALPPGS